METLTEQQTTVLPQTTALPDGLAEPETTEPEAGFYPDTPEKVDWVLGQIADRRARAARLRENAEKRARQEEAEAAFFDWRYGVALRAFARQQLEGGRRKSLTLGHGTLGFRTKPAGVQVGDEGAAIAWAKENAPGAVVERLDKKTLAKALLATGEAVDFAAFTPAEEVFFIN